MAGKHTSLIENEPNGIRRDRHAPGEDIRHTLSLNLRLLRLLHGWSQEQLAERAGLHRTYVGAVERREIAIGIDNLQRLAHALGTTPAQLLEQPASSPPGVGEPAAHYAPAPATAVSASSSNRHVVYLRQIALFRLWIPPRRSRVMAPHESQCKEAAGTTGETDAHPAWLVTGSSRRTQRSQPQLYRRRRARRA